MKSRYWFLAVSLIFNLSAQEEKLPRPKCGPQQKCINHNIEKKGETERVTSMKVIYRFDKTKPMLKNAWRDPQGLKWGDLVLGVDQKPLRVEYGDAVTACQNIGARLPTVEEATRLRLSMGAYPNKALGYFPQILPNLTSVHQGHLVTHYFWLEATDYAETYAWYFDGNSGIIDRHFLNGKFSVRCVSM